MESRAFGLYDASVLSKIFAVVARWRRFILVAALVAAVALGLAGRARGGPAFRPWPSIASLACAGLLIIAMLARREPPTLDSRPGAIAVAGYPAQVFPATGFTLLGGILAGEGILIRGDGPFDIVMTSLFVLAMVLIWSLAWGRSEVLLRPDGVLDRGPIGSMFVPWEALDPGSPAVAVHANYVALRYRQPELVRRRGLRPARRRMEAGGDTILLARLIHHYVTSPEDREAIGAPEQFQRALRWADDH
jgi:hypothetical protein